MGSIGPMPALGGLQPGTTATPGPQPKSKRGRKQNDDLPPSRSRDVQRAFRARRAERLAWLESRVSELEIENADLRRRLGLPDPPRVAPPPSTALKRSTSDASATHTPSGTPLPLPLPPMSTAARQQQSATAWMSPTNSLYLPHPMHPAAPLSSHSGSPLTEAADLIDEESDMSRFLEFCVGLIGDDGVKLARTSIDPNVANRPTPPEFLSCTTAWNVLAPYAPTANDDPSSLSPYTPHAMGNSIRGLVGVHIRIEKDRILVSNPAVTHLQDHIRNFTQQQHQYASDNGGGGGFPSFASYAAAHPGLMMQTGHLAYPDGSSPGQPQQQQQHDTGGPGSGRPGSAHSSIADVHGNASGASGGGNGGSSVYGGGSDGGAAPFDLLSGSLHPFDGH